MIVPLIIATGLLCFVWWAIGYAAPPDLVKPLRILALVVYAVWLVRLLGVF
jgi:hypothetical protein